MNKITGIYRSARTGLVVGTMDDGSTELEEDWSLENSQAAAKAAKAQGLWDWPSDTDWLVPVMPDMFGDVTPGGGEDNPTPDPGEGGEPGEGPEGAEGDGSGDGEGETGDGDGDDNDGNDGEPAEGEAGDETEDMEDMEIEMNMPGENAEASTGNAMADNIWELIRPLVDERDQAYAQAMAGSVQTFVKKAVAKMVAEQMAEVPKGLPNGPVPAPAPDDAPKFEAPKAELRHREFDKVLMLVARGIHVYLPGPPGTGKSHMAKQIADTLDRPFGVQSFSPMSTESALKGFRNAHGEYVRTIYREIFEHGGIFLGDELDNANPAIVAVLNSGLANEFMEFPDGVVKRHPDFVFIATANTLGTGPTAQFAGRQKLDPATLNRFAKVHIDTDEDVEDALVHAVVGTEVGTAWLKKVRFVRRAVADLRIDLFVTMRDSIMGAKMIAPGQGQLSQVEALEHTCLGSLTADQRDKIKAWKG